MVHAEGAVERERKEWIDIARAIAIFLVVLSHVERKGMITDYTAAGGVAVFFLLSGYVYRAGEKAGEFWKKKAARIVIPYLIVGLISIVIYDLLGSIAASALNVSVKEETFSGQVLNLFLGTSKRGGMKWNESLWFVPCFLCVLILARVLDRITGKGWQRILAAAVCFAAGTVITEYTKIYLPWQLETALHACVFFAAGREVRLWIKDAASGSPLKAGVPAQGLLCVCGFLLSLFLMGLNGNFSLRMDQYPSYILSYGAMALSVPWVILLSRILAAVMPAKPKAYLAGTGIRSYDIMLWNKFPVLALQVLLPKILPGISGVFMENDSIQGLTAASAGAVFCILLCLVWIRIYRSILLRLQ